MALIVNLLVLLLVLLIIWKIFEFALTAFGTTVTPPVKAIVGLIFLLVFLIQALGVIGYGTPLFNIYR